MAMPSALWELFCSWSITNEIRNSLWCISFLLYETLNYWRMSLKYYFMGTIVNPNSDAMHARIFTTFTMFVPYFISMLAMGLKISIAFPRTTQWQRPMVHWVAGKCHGRLARWPWRVRAHTCAHMRTHATSQGWPAWQLRKRVKEFPLVHFFLTI